MKTFVLIYEDRKGNELKRDEITTFSIFMARNIRNKILATSMINDLYKIKVKAK